MMCSIQRVQVSKSLPIFPFVHWFTCQIANQSTFFHRGASLMLMVIQRCWIGWKRLARSLWRARHTNRTRVSVGPDIPNNWLPAWCVQTIRPQMAVNTNKKVFESIPKHRGRGCRDFKIGVISYLTEMNEMPHKQNCRNINAKLETYWHCSTLANLQTVLLKHTDWH